MLNEYRGLNVNGTWTDTDPNGWDLFIQSNVGLGDASALPMTIHDMSSTEVSWNSGRVYPFEIGGSNVYAVRLTNDSEILANCYYSNGTALGEMYIGPPSSITKGCIYTERINNHDLHLG